MTALFSIWLIHLAALVTPGPQMMFLVFLSSSGQDKAARFAIIGIALGAFVWATSAILGVHTLFELFPEARLAIQLVGASYLIYLAIKVWKPKGQRTQSEREYFRPLAAIGRGFLVNMTNPKAALFYGSVFSTTLPAKADMTFLVAAVVLVLINCIVWHYLVTVLCSRPLIQDGFKRFELAMRRVTGSIFGAFGAALLISTFREVRKSSS